jgi:enamine deaminase RidA (YjgF/YER057c/UK114 family)
MTHRLLNPPELGPPKGYSNGVVAGGDGTLVFVAGQIGWNASQELVGDDVAEQFGQALANVVTVVRAAGGAPEHLVRLTIYVTDRDAYVGARKAIGEAYRRVMGGHYPAMALIMVAGLVEPRAKVEIEGTAVLPRSG